MRTNIDLDDYVSLVSLPYAFDDSDVEPPVQTALETVDSEIKDGLSRLTHFLRRANSVLNKRK